MTLKRIIDPLIRRWEDISLFSQILYRIILSAPIFHPILAEVIINLGKPLEGDIKGIWEAIPIGQYVSVFLDQIIC